MIPFYKMSGSGNDFIIIDNRDGRIDGEGLPRFIEAVCRRRLSVGADGFILIENSDEADFSWQFFNSDGGRAEMCGNGSRCAARFAYLNGIAGPTMEFMTDAGKLWAEVADDRVRIRMTDPSDPKLAYPLAIGDRELTVSSVNTGVPHVVIAVDRVADVAVEDLGRQIRYHEAFAPAGTNVNFVSPIESGAFAMRTYERGVEGETLACGTGAVATALIMAALNQVSSPIRIRTQSGSTLAIYFQETNGVFTGIDMEGDARVVYSGDLWEDAWTYEGMAPLA